MYNGKKNFFKGDTGSVMMETVLVLPLYIAFFSGIFLVGDLQVCVGRLYSADRTVVTHNSNRHVENKLDKDLLSKFVFSNGIEDENPRVQYDYGNQTKINSFSVKNEDTTWGQRVEGNSNLTFTLPTWTIGWQKAVNHIFDNEKNNSKDKSTISLGKYYTFMRKKDDSRQEPEGEKYGVGPDWYNPDWYNIYCEPFLAGEVKDVSGAYSIGKYERLDDYVKWSDK